jgi:hypothetical protein
MGESELRLRIVHHDDVAHTRGCSSPGDWSAIQHENLHAGAGAFGSAGSSDDPGTDNDEIEGFGHGKNR